MHTTLETGKVADLDVLICGAGAAGLTLAIDLARRGVSFRLIDQLESPFGGSRGKGIQPRTLEVMEDLGVLDRVMAASGPYPPVRKYRSYGEYEDVEEFSCATPTTQEPFRAPLMIPQFRTEAALRDRLGELGGAPEYGARLSSFDVTADGVLSHVIGPSGVEAIRSRYLVGADGGRSSVRRQLGVDFPGKTLGTRAIVADIALDGLSRDVWHRFNSGDMTRQLAICALPHTDLFQLQAPLAEEDKPDLTTAGLQRFIDARLPTSGIVVQGVEWASNYSMNARLAERYRADSVFLIGDAAHIHPPTGGQGLNTSVQDAYNLGWKLAAVLAGASATLLDSYEQERRPIAAGMLGLSTDLLEKTRRGEWKRGREVHQLDLGYASSPLSLGSPARATGVQDGDRAPDALLTDRRGKRHRLFELLRGPQWTLIALECEMTPIVTSRAGLQIIWVGAAEQYRDPENAFAAHYGMVAGEVALIRPDGYLAGVVHASEIEKVYNYLDSTVGSARDRQATSCS